MHQGSLLFCDEPANLKANMGKGVLSIRSAQPRAVRDLLRTAPGLSSLLLTGDGVHIVVDDAAVRMPQFTALLQSAGVPFESLRQVAPTIEDLFVDAVEAREKAHA